MKERRYSLSCNEIKKLMEKLMVLKITELTNDRIDREIRIIWGEIK